MVLLERGAPRLYLFAGGIVSHEAARYPHTLRFFSFEGICIFFSRQLPLPLPLLLLACLPPGHALQDEVLFSSLFTSLLVADLDENGPR